MVPPSRKPPDKPAKGRRTGPQPAQASARTTTQAPSNNRPTGDQEAKDDSLHPIGTFVPLTHLTILEQEAKLFGARRGQFLEMLLKRKLGMLEFNRPANAPTYEFGDSELSTSVRFVWYLREEMKELLDRDRLQMGNLTVQAWIVVEINRWIGRPLGLRSPGTP